MKVSIIIPVYNEINNISRCLDSLLSQTMDSSNFEIIVVDDHSVDSTKEFIRDNYGDKIRLVVNDKKGPARARNLGTKMAKGEILVFTDADCELHPNWLKEMVFPIKTGQADGVQGRYLTKQKAIIARFVQYEIEERYKRLKNKRYIDSLSTYSASYKRDQFLDVNGFNDNYKQASGEDSDLSYRLEQRGAKFIFNSKAVCYHLHPENLKDYFKIKQNRGYWRVLLYRDNKNKILNDSYTPQTLKVQVALIYIIFVLFLLTLFHSEFLYLFILSIFTLLISSFPFVVRVLRKDFTVGVISFFMVPLRGLAIAIGLIKGTVKFLFTF
jgi:glycosyltransferase involved in cell wall biosynthesis